MNLNPNNKDLIERCIQGDRRAQFELYQNYSKAMFNICLRMMGSRDEAEDMLQVSFVDVYRHLGSYKYASTLGSWIKRIVINNCISTLKKRRLHMESIDDGHIQIADTDGAHEYDGPLTVDAVKRAMDHLPDGYRTVFSLYVFEGYDHQEIGQILSVSEATSKSQFSRAKKKMRELLQTNV